MALVSFIGRVLFASVFILSAWQEFNEFGVDGGPAVKELRPKFNVFSKTVSSHTGLQVPEFDIKYVVAAAVAFKGVGSILFTFGSTIGAYLLVLHQLILTPIVYDFYNYEKEKKEFGLLFTKFSQNLALLGALLFFIGMKNSIPTRQLKKKAPKTKTV
ncbi:hypothetical protein ERO13_A09G057800v2 [Gossypium hirsutum]|uniref:HR-like lesion-inducer n=4 Tax=Gossypium TaxID=3633 RepID=A0A2P5XDD3_GOSBA|nr:uncharacterized protein LOC107888893 [Gossypium hirsutum]KAB2065023.1 hypothetical protein ES319_A09G061800v1 [Gossypium barbadense]TYH01667.1 hypothetical protein ES288_A09G078000v1 [Gossypium darwinii]TYJ17618.1 hypothetical protein E1A91_A09G064200v1 [Gossypium mustelinum]KAG4182662.1 hypothetical protein ERO13_A09G057800v2 [Gossypium hirsutum]PPS01322.1 hypothetical protein GOBAR_AA19342 [Gossypium barbadense]